MNNSLSLKSCPYGASQFGKSCSPIHKPFTQVSMDKAEQAVAERSASHSLSQDTSEGSACKPVIPHSPRTQNQRNNEISAFWCIKFILSIANVIIALMHAKTEVSFEGLAGLLYLLTAYYVLVCFCKEENL